MKLQTTIRNILNWINRVLKTCININTMSFVIAVLAAYISYRALGESIKQRESMYKPELFIGEEMFYADITDVNNITFYTMESDSSLCKVVMRPWYRLINVGMGSALSVYGHLLHNSETMMDYLTNNKMDGVQRINGDDVVDKLVFQEDTIEAFNKGYISDWTVDYVLPISQSDMKSIQYFPPKVLDDIIRAYLWVANEKDEKEISCYSIPIELDYKDINGKWYKKDYTLSVVLFMIDDKVCCRIKSGLSMDDYLREFSESIEN